MDRLEWSYASFPLVEHEFHEALGESLHPRGPDVLFELVAGLGLPAGAVAVDVGCGDGRHTRELAARFGFEVTGVDPFPEVEGPRFLRGAAEALPLADASVDLVWCRDALTHVADLHAAYREFHRVLRAGGSAVIYQMFAGERLEPREAEWLSTALGNVPSSADPAVTEAAIEASGLCVIERIELTTEWGEHAQETTGKPGERLLWAARLLREPERYVSRFGRDAYEVMLGDCLWHVYGMIGKLTRRAFVLARP